MNMNIAVAVLASLVLLAGTTYAQEPTANIFSAVLEGENLDDIMNLFSTGIGCRANQSVSLNISDQTQDFTKNVRDIFTCMDTYVDPGLIEHVKSENSAELYAGCNGDLFCYADKLNYTESLIPDAKQLYALTKPCQNMCEATASPTSESSDDDQYAACYTSWCLEYFN